MMLSRVAIEDALDGTAPAPSYRQVPGSAASVRSTTPLSCTLRIWRARRASHSLDSPLWSTAPTAAASALAPVAYAAAGARVIAISADPDGLNINDGCGSTHLENLQKAVVDHGADLGLAHDGDADRCLAVDETGSGGRR